MAKESGKQDKTAFLKGELGESCILVWILKAEKLLWLNSQIMERGQEMEK